MKLKRVMRNTILVVLSVVISAVVISVNKEKVFASDTITDAETGLVYTVSDGTAKITGAYMPSDFIGSMEIPSTLGGYPVTSIGDSAFYNRYWIQSLIIPDSVKSIGIGAFSNCLGLQSVEIPSSVTYINGRPFPECPYLSQILVDDENINYSDIDGVLFNKDQTTLIEYPCGKSGSYVIPNSVTNIGKLAFADSNISSIFIPNSVTSIGFESFACCRGLKNVSIPDSVSSIGSGAFEGCTNLIGVTIPDSVTTISPFMFQGCTKLPSIQIPETVTTIGGDAFYECKGLKSITIPNGVLSIGSTAFGLCTGIASITIPDSVTTIGWSAFTHCFGLTNVTIPSSVTSIDSLAFEDCISLSSVFFEGNAPTMGSDVFQFCNSDFIIYYLPNSTGFTSPTWLGYPSEVYKGISGTGNKTSAVSSFCVTVKDRSTNKSVSGVTVKFGEKLQTTISDGSAVITDVIDNTCAYLTVSKEGYNTYECSYTVTEKNSTYIVYLEKSSGTVPYISSAIMTRNNKQYDIRNTKQVFLKSPTNTAGETCSLDVSVNWNGHTPGKIYLFQDAEKTLENSDGKFTGIDIAALFNSGNKPIYLYVTSEDGSLSTYYETQIVVQSVSNKDKSPGSDGYFNILDDFGVDIPENVPVFGKTSFDVGLKNVSVTFEIEGNTMKAIIGVTVDEMKIGGWDKYKKDIKNLKSVKPAEARAIFEKYATGSKLKCLELHSSSISAEVIGYYEMVYSDGRWQFLEGGLGVQAKGKNSTQFQYNLLGIPVYVELGFGAEGKVEGKILNVDPAGGYTPQVSMDADFSLYGELGTGIGFANVITAGIKGKAELAYTMNTDNSHEKCGVEGSANFKIKIFGFLAAEKEFAKGYYLIYETGNPNGLIAARSMNQVMTVNNLYNLIDPDSHVTFENRAYANQASLWLGGRNIPASVSSLPVTFGNNNSQDITLLSSSSRASWLTDTQETGNLYAFTGIEYTNKAISTLQTNIYPDAAPVVSTMDGKKVMVWLSDNITRTAANKTMLVYSVYDEGTAVWSAPLALLDDGMADYSPNIADGFVTWQKAGQIFDESTVTLAGIAASTEIFAAKWNGTGFDVPAQITANTVVDAQPQIAVNGSTAAVVWTSNTNGDILGTTGVNQIMMSTFDGTAWSAPTVVTDNLQAITNISAYYKDSALYIAFVPDSDNDLNTIDDRDIYLITDGMTTQITNNDVIDSNPVFAEVNGAANLFWYNSGNINFQPLTGGSVSTVFASAKDGLSDQFSVIINTTGKAAILWTRISEDASEIQGALFDGTTWSEDIAVSNVGAYAKYPSGILNDDGSLLIGFNNTAKIADGDSFVEGATDLCTLFVVPSYNLSVSNVSYDEAALVPSADMPISVNVTNNGELEVSSLTATVTNGDASVNNVMTISEALKPGETKTVAVNYKVPATPVHQTISVNIVPEGQTDSNVSDNTVSQEIGYADVNILSTQLYTPGKFSTGYVTINNESYITAENVKVDLRADSAGGEVLSSIDVGTLSRNTNSNISFDIDPTLLSYEGGINQIYIVVTCDNEQNIGNNDDYLIITQPTFSVTFDAKEGTAGEGTDYSQNIGLNSPAVSPVNEPTKTGHSFEGWYKDTDCTIPWDFGTDLISSDITLYAKYTIENYSVTFNSMGGSEIADANADYNTSISAPADPVKTGYPFIGWYKDEACLNVWNFSTDVVTGSITLYAKWKINNYSVTFDSQSGTAVNAVNADYITVISAPSAPTRTGYVFSGWYKDAACQNAWDFDTNVVTSNTTLYAKWIASNYSVTFSSQGGSTVKAVSADYNTTIIAPTAPTKTGYTFNGWYRDASCMQAWYFSTDVVTGNITLYARWMANNYPVTFSSQGGTAVASSNGIYNTTISPPVAPTRTGYSFSGWYKAADCQNAWKFNADVVTDSITLYAKWKINSYTVTYNSQDGSTTPSAKSDYNTTISAPAAPTRIGYTFNGWYRDASCMQAWYFGADVVSEDITLYAKWLLVTVTYQTHVQDIGWQDYVSDGATSGTSGQSKRLEAIHIKLAGIDGGIEYRTHVQDIGWMDWAADDALSGTSGQSKRLEAIQIRLTGTVADLYDVYYRVHAQNTGWLDWAKNGESAGTAGYGYRLEAIEIQLVPKGGAAPGTTTRSFVDLYAPKPIVDTVSYKTHVQDIGWQAYVSNGEMSGTSAQSKRLEAIQIKLENMAGGIEYRTHVQDYGWMNWVADDALSGTSGQSKRLEAIQIRLTGAAAEKYDIYYCVHAQNTGWLDWAKNGESAGTAAYGYRLEAIKIVLVPKGGEAPGATARAFIQG